MLSFAVIVGVHHRVQGSIFAHQQVLSSRRCAAKVYITAFIFFQKTQPGDLHRFSALTSDTRVVIVWFFRDDPCQYCRSLAVSNPRLLFLSSETKLSSHHVCFPSLIPSSTPKGEYAVDLIHHAFTHVSSRYVFALVNSGVSVPCLVDFLHLFFEACVRFATKDLKISKLFSKGTSCRCT